MAGKARSCLNALKHSRYARCLPEKLRAAGYSERAALYSQVREEIASVFRLARPIEIQHARHLANQVYAMAQRGGVLGTKPECPLLSARLGPRIYSYSRFRIHDPATRTGLAYWVQRKGFWNHQRLFTAMLAKDRVKEPSLRRMLEHRLRRRVVRLRCPSIWRWIQFKASTKRRRKKQAA